MTDHPVTPSDAAGAPILWSLRDVEVADGRLVIPALDVSAGLTAVLGVTGAGKTSLLDLLVEYSRPASGRVERRLEVAGDRPALFWAPQDGGLWPHLTVREHLEAVAPSGDGGVVDRMLETFGLLAQSHDRPATLSGGERDRLNLARALTADPVVLVLDEPLANVGGDQRDEGWRAIRAWADRGARSVVFATHEPRPVVAYAERVVGLAGGRVIHDGTVEALYHHPPSEAVASLLGPGNWFEMGDAARWLGAAGGIGPRRSLFLRPERLIIVEDPSSPIRVETVAFAGDVETVDVRHGEDGAVRRVVHRPPFPRLRPGQRVSMTPLLALLIACFVSLLVGCGNGDARELDLEVVRAHSLPPAGARMAGPRAVAFDADGSYAVLDTVGRVIRYDAAGALTTIWPMPAATAGRPEGLCFLPSGELAVADTHYHRVLVFDRTGRVARSFGQNGDDAGAFRYPIGITLDGAGHFLVCEYGGNDRVQRFDPTGAVTTVYGRFGAAPGQFQRPSGIAWHGDRVYVADAINNRIQVFSNDGEHLATLGEGVLDFPYDLGIGPSGDLIVVEYGAARVTRLTREGRVVGRFGRPGSSRGEFRTPWGIAASTDGRILVADTGNRRIVELRPKGGASR